MEKANKRPKEKIKSKKKSIRNKLTTRTSNKGKNMDNRQYLSMGEYISLAKKTINKFAPQFYNGLNKEILNSEDAISDIASAIMYADWRFDPNRSGSSGMKKTLYSYRNQCAIWAIKTFITNKYKKKTKDQMSLDYSSSGDDSLAYHESIKDNKQSNPLDILIDKEQQEYLVSDLDSIFNSGLITDKQKEQLKMYYMDDMTLSEIGKKFGVSREAIRQNLKRAIEHIQSYAHQYKS